MKINFVEKEGKKYERDCTAWGLDASKQTLKIINEFLYSFVVFIVLLFIINFSRGCVFCGTIIGAVVNMYLWPLSRLLNHKKVREINELKINRLLLQKFGWNHLEKKMVSMIGTLIQYPLLYSSSYTKIKAFKLDRNIANLSKLSLSIVF